jgi:hypothetical protein
MDVRKAYRLKAMEVENHRLKLPLASRQPGQGSSATQMESAPDSRWRVASSNLAAAARTITRTAAYCSGFLCVTDRLAQYSHRSRRDSSQLMPTRQLDMHGFLACPTGRKGDSAGWGTWRLAAEKNIAAIRPRINRSLCDSLTFFP